MRAKRTDSNQVVIMRAIRMLGFPVMDLSHAGNGVEDLLVGLHRLIVDDAEVICFWIVVEAKVPRNKRGTVQPSQFKPAQKEWRNKTACWPRITVVSAQDAVEQIRELTR